MLFHDAVHCSAVEILYPRRGHIRMLDEMTQNS